MGSSPIPRFLAIAYALSIGLGVLIGATGGHESRFIGLGYFSMLIPAIAACVVRFAMNEPFRIDWDRLPLTYVPVALLLMPVLMHAAMLPVMRAYEGRLPWLSWLGAGADGLYHTAAPFVWGDLTRAAFVGHVAANAVFGVIVVSVLAFFEEVGWRAWLLPRVIERIGPRRGIVMVSILWALWHIPYALSGIQQLEGVRPGIAAVVVPIGVAGSGLIIGWLWARTRSIWIVSLAHGALNNWGQYAFKFMQFARTPPVIVSLAGDLAVLLTGCVLVAVALPRDRGATV